MAFKPLIPPTPTTPTETIPGPDESVIPAETVTLDSAEIDLFNKLESIISYLKDSHLQEFLGTDKLLAYTQIQSIIFKIESLEYQTRKQIEDQQGDNKKTNV